MVDPSPPLIVILGPTASGKSALAIRLATRLNAEIISCDSTQLYRGFDIGTAKLTPPQQMGVPHHLIDVLNIEQDSTAGAFREMALAVLADLRNRAKIPILVAGTGLYLRALLLGLAQVPQRSEKLRARLRKSAAAKPPGHLHRILNRLDPATAAKISASDQQKLIRAVEVCLLAKRRLSDLHDAGRSPLTGWRILKLGLQPDREQLYSRIHQRTLTMFERGWLDEVQNLLSLHIPLTAKPFGFIGYSEVSKILQNQMSQDAAIAAIDQATRRYAKRQITWFRREPDVHWLAGFGDHQPIQIAALNLVAHSLAQPHHGPAGDRSIILVTPHLWTSSDDLFVSKKQHNISAAERAVLVGIGWKRASRFPGMLAGEQGRESLLELVELAKSAGADVASTVFQIRDVPDSATLVGRGKLDEIRAEAIAQKAPLIIFDSNLTPMQQRNIEEHTERRVIDRTQLILDIFARHARSREGQLQVELAQLDYLLPRLTGKGASMSRLGGKSGGGAGAGGAGGGAGRIGVRGPGEKKLETDRRRIRDRIAKIQTGIDEVRKQRALRREARNAVPLGTIALVGYTNAGKSTLFNALSRAEVLVSPRMFATLDPTIRALRLPSNRRVLVSDTVGFIRDLPKGLLTAFRATLEEVQEAALIMHVSDVSAPNHKELDQEVDKILQELNIADRPKILVLTKVDGLSWEERHELEKHIRKMKKSDQTPVLVSAVTGEGVDELLRRIDLAMPTDPLQRLSLRIPLSEGRVLALIHALGRVLHSHVDGTEMFLDAEVPDSIIRRLHLKEFVAEGTYSVLAT